MQYYHKISGAKWSLNNVDNDIIQLVYIQLVHLVLEQDIF